MNKEPLEIIILQRFILFGFIYNNYYLLDTKEKNRRKLGDSLLAIYVLFDFIFFQLVLKCLPRYF